MIPSNRQEVAFLVQNLLLPQRQKTILCIDSYQNGVLQGRLYGPDSRARLFDSLSRFLVMMDTMLEEEFLPSYLPDSPSGSIPKGNRATFELQILFCQHSSWQGAILWKEQRRRQNFRSVLELISLLDSALYLPEEKDAV